MKCPKCNSDRSHFVSNITTKGFSNESACAGCFCFGIPGLLFGFCDSGKQDTREFWMCDNCGSKFQKSEVEEKEQRIQKCKEIVNTATQDELANLSNYISTAKSKVEKTRETFYAQLKSEKINNNDMIKANKTMQIILIVAILAGFVSLICFASEENTLGLVLLVILFCGIIVFKKNKNKIIDKYGSAELKISIKNKEEAKEKLERLETIAKAKDDLQEMTGNEK